MTRDYDPVKVYNFFVCLAVARQGPDMKLYWDALEKFACADWPVEAIDEHVQYVRSLFPNKRELLKQYRRIRKELNDV